MKKIALIIISVAITTSIFAQNIFFSTTEGLTMRYITLDKKGKFLANTKQTIKLVEGSENNLSISYVMQVLDEKERPKMPEVSYKVYISNNFTSFETIAYLAGAGSSYSISEGDRYIHIPSSISPGVKLEDVKFTLKSNLFDASSAFAFSVFEFFDRQCLTIEDIIVPAGTFRCYKLTERITGASAGIIGTFLADTWYAPNIGIVKVETRKKNGKLVQVFQLIKIEE